ncbi:MAG: DUF2177 family protein [Candidatus Woesearchaeota archaeon]|nr:DUF2177 family protein [Candidatus Woesearchaeota archaeon]
MNYKRFLMLYVLVIVLDLTWMTFLGGNFYRGVLGHIMRTEAATFTVVLAAILLWGLMALGVEYFVLPQKKPLFAGALFGLMVYGVYELTNYAVLKDWPLSVVAVDILWGVVLFSILAYVGSKI